MNQTAILITEIIDLLKNKYPNDEELGSRVRSIFNGSITLEEMVSKEDLLQHFMVSNKPGEC